MDWSDLRIALAVDRHRTLAAAAAALHLDPTTVSRRISALEEALGTSLFRRSGGGWVTTEAGRRVVDHASRMATEVRALQHGVDGALARVEGTVRLTLLDDLALWLVAPHVPALRELHPGLVLRLLCTDAVLDLGKGQADVALRLNRPTEPGMRVRRVGSVAVGLFAAPDYLARVPIPSLPWEGEVDLIALGDDERPPAELRWARGLLPGARVAVAAGTVPVVHALVRNGVGVGVLAVVPALADGLVRLDLHQAPVERPLWRVVPESIADAPRVRAVLDWLDTLPLR